MKTTTKIIAATLAVVSFAAVSVVSAHPGGGYGMGSGPSVGMMGSGPGMGNGMGSGHRMGMGMGMGMGGMGVDSPAVLAARLGDLKAILKITPAQDAAWQKYETQLRQQVATRQAFHTTMQAQMQDPKVTIDHNAQHETMTKLFAAQGAARDELYAALTTEQKALADQQARPGHGHHMGSRAQTK